MRSNLDASKGLPHAEEPQRGVSKHARRHCSQDRNAPPSLDTANMARTFAPLTWGGPTFRDRNVGVEPLERSRREVDSTSYLLAPASGSGSIVRVAHRLAANRNCHATSMRSRPGPSIHGFRGSGARQGPAGPFSTRVMMSEAHRRDDANRKSDRSVAWLTASKKDRAPIGGSSRRHVSVATDEAAMPAIRQERDCDWASQRRR